MAVTDMYGSVPGTWSTPTPLSTITFVINGTGNAFVGRSRTSTAQTPTIATGVAVGGVPYTIKEPLGITTLSFALQDANNTMTYTVLPNTVGTVPGA